MVVVDCWHVYRCESTGEAREMPLSRGAVSTRRCARRLRVGHVAVDASARPRFFPPFLPGPTCIARLALSLSLAAPALCCASPSRVLCALNRLSCHCSAYRRSPSRSHSRPSSTEKEAFLVMLVLRLRQLVALVVYVILKL